MWITLFEKGPWFYGVVLCLCVTLFLWVKGKKRLNLPPGPRGLPVIGFLPFLSLTEPHIQLDKMRKKYGNVFGMYMGSRYFLILSDIASTKEAFNRDDFTLRPEGSFQVSKDYKVFGGTHGQHWSDHRKLATSCLRQLCFKSESFDEDLLNQFSLALDALQKESSESKNGEVNLRESIVNAIYAISSVIIYGKVYPQDHEVTKITMRYLRAFADFGTAISMDTCLPWLKPLMYIFGPVKSSIRKAFKDMENCYWSEIDFHKQNPVDKPNDFIYYYLAERNKPNMDRRFTIPDLNGDGQTMLFAAADTVRASAEWFALCMAEYPKAQEKAYKEIVESLGSSGKANFMQRQETPYTVACILEALRFRTITPVGVNHGSVNKTVKFLGYDIPEESVIISNFWSIHHDPQNWEHPDTFYPEHFLTDNGTTVTTPECFIPFSIGKRLCIGDKLALKELYVLSVGLLQRFQILPPEGGVNIKGRIRVSCEPCFPVVRLIPRI